MNGPDPALHLLDVKRGHGLEIGPLFRPRVLKSDGDVRYVDHCPTDELREIYSHNADASQHVADIVEVDYVVGPGTSLAAAVGHDGPFDYVIASHVIEHVANPIGWLQDIGQVLGDDGLISLVVPDKRFCFDTNRRPTLAQDWVDWYLRDLRQPCFVQVFDFLANTVTVDGAVDTAGIWAGTAEYAGARRQDVEDADVAGYEGCLDLQQSGRYIDVHAGVYTPATFLDLIAVGARLGLLAYEVAYFVPTPVNTLEFYVTLRKLPPGLPMRVLSSVADAAQTLARAPTPVDAHFGGGNVTTRDGSTPEVLAADVPAPAGTPLDAVSAAGPRPEATGLLRDELSAMERSLIKVKRAVMLALRSSLRAATKVLAKER